MVDAMPMLSKRPIATQKKGESSGESCLSPGPPALPVGEIVGSVLELFVADDENEVTVPLVEEELEDVLAVVDELWYVVVEDKVVVTPTVGQVCALYIDKGLIVEGSMYRGASCVKTVTELKIMNVLIY